MPLMRKNMILESLAALFGLALIAFLILAT